MHAPVQTALELVAGDVQSALNNFKVDGQVVKAWDTIIDIVSQHRSLKWTQNYLPHFVACEPSNRGGVGIMLQDALSTASQHCTAGWSYTKACEGAWAVELKPNSKELADATAFTNRIAKSQSVARVDSPSVASFGGSHRNYFLRAAASGAPCTDNKLAPSGSLDAVELSKQHQGISRALESGLVWNVLSIELVRKFPEIMTIGAAALNVRGTQDVSEMEGLCTIHSYLKIYEAAGMKPEDALNKAVEEAIRTEPFWAPWARSLGKFCQVTPAELVIEAKAMKASVVKVGDSKSNNHGKTCVINVCP